MTDQPDDLDAQRTDEDRPFEESLRPRTLDEYVGQEALKANLRVYIQAAKRRGEALDHILFYGPPGLGKTTLAYVIANELGTRMIPTSGPALDKKGTLVGMMTSLERGDVFFIDEIHRLGPAVEEVLYPAMEDFRVEVSTGEGLGAAFIPVRLDAFTLVGATTKWGSLSGPLRDRFGVVERIDYYTPEDIERIVIRSARILGIDLSPEGAGEIARRARLTPRIANRLLRRARDFAQIEGRGVIDGAIADLALRRLGIDDRGLDRLDRGYLEALVTRFDGGPTGLDTLCAALSEQRDTIEDVVEPYLLRLGLIQRTPRGRTATTAAREIFRASRGKRLGDLL
jgi:Holliday junction DNA helicase RuvB